MMSVERGDRLILGRRDFSLVEDAAGDVPDAGTFQNAVDKALGQSNSQFTDQPWYRNAVFAMATGRVSAGDVLNDLATLTDDYARDLGRSADAEGLNTYMNQLIQGRSAGDINNDIASSPEAARALRALITHFQNRPADEVADKPWLDAQVYNLKNGSSLAQIGQGLGSFYGEAGVFQGAVDNALGHGNSQFAGQQWYQDGVAAMESGAMSASDIIQDLNTVASDYTQDLGHSADANGLNTAMDALIHGASAGSVNSAIAALAPPPAPAPVAPAPVATAPAPVPLPTTPDAAQQDALTKMQAAQDAAATFGAEQFAQQTQAEQALTQISNAQNEATNFLQTAASNAKSAVAKD